MLGDKNSTVTAGDRLDRTNRQRTIVLNLFGMF